MKKLLLALFVSVPFLGAAQLKLSNMRIEKEDDLLKGMVTVTNSGTTDATVKVKRTVEVLAPGHSTYFCWGNCYGPTVNESPDADARVIPAGGSDASAFYGDVLTNGANGTTKVNYCFYDKKNSFNEICYTFIYDVTNGVQTVTVTQDDMLTSIYPNPVQNMGKIGYDLSGKKYTEANLVVRNLTGAVVKNYKITQNSGEISISAEQMTNGIYMYSLVVDGKAILTRKMTVMN